MWFVYKNWKPVYDSVTLLDYVGVKTVTVCSVQFMIYEFIKDAVCALSDLMLLFWHPVSKMFCFKTSWDGG